MTDHDKTRCEEAIAHLFDYLYGELDADKRTYISRHLEECRGCYSRAEFERLLRKKVADLADEPVPATLQRRLEALLNQF